MPNETPAAPLATSPASPPPAPSASREPRVGDWALFTHFAGRPDSDETGRAELALIVRVWDGGKVNLTVFPEHGDPHPKPYIPRDDSRMTPQTWSFVTTADRFGSAVR